MRAVVPPGRIVGLDMARCLALVGMIATHALVPEDGNGATLVQQVAGGRSAALFAVLAGTSLALMSGGSTPVRGRERLAASAGLAVRALLITCIGLFLGGLPTTIAVILAYYGVLFLLGLPFLGLRAEALALLSAAWLVATPVLSHAVRPGLPERGFVSPGFESLADPWQLVTELTLTGYYPAVPWLAYLLAGMALGRLDLSRPRTAGWLAGVGTVVAVLAWTGSGVLLERPGAADALVATAYEPVANASTLGETLELGLHGTTPTGSWWWLAVRTAHSGTPFDLAHTIGTSLIVIGLALALGRRVPRLAAVAFGAGAMTLSLYSLHVVLRTPAFLPEDNVETFLTHVVIVLVVGAVYRLAGRRGPAEEAVATFAMAASEAVRRRDVREHSRVGTYDHRRGIPS